VDNIKKIGCKPGPSGPLSPKTTLGIELGGKDFEITRPQDRVQNGKNSRYISWANSLCANCYRFCRSSPILKGNAGRWWRGGVTAELTDRSWGYICVCVCLQIQGPLRECHSIRPGASGLPYYCTPLVCIPAVTVIGLLAVWRHNKPKPTNHNMFIHVNKINQFK